MTAPKHWVKHKTHSKKRCLKLLAFPLVNKVMVEVDENIIIYYIEPYERALVPESEDSTFLRANSSSAL